MKKRGFIAISVIYSFFLVFLTLLIFIVNNFVTNRVLLNNVKKKVKEDIADTNFRRYLLNHYEELKVKDDYGGLLKHNLSLESGDKYDSYRYVGEKPNNYVCFKDTVCSDNLYRVIGIIDNKVKIIKYEDKDNYIKGIFNELDDISIYKNMSYTNMFFWDNKIEKEETSESNGEIGESGEENIENEMVFKSKIYKTIEDYYNKLESEKEFEYKKFFENAKIHAGGIEGEFFDSENNLKSAVELTIENIYKAETSNTGDYLNSYFGLPYISDYGYATYCGDSDCYNNVIDKDRININNNWMNEYLNFEENENGMWLLTRDFKLFLNVFYLDNLGNLTLGSIFENLDSNTEAGLNGGNPIERLIVPTHILKNTVRIFGGQGSKERPYIIG